MAPTTRAQVTAELRELIRPRPARGASLIVEGAPGVGKTTVVTSCVADAARSGARIISAAADEFTVRQPFASVAALLESDRPNGTDPVQTAAARIDELCSRGPVLIWIDDAQYLDSASLSVLIRLWPSTRDLPLTLILSTRPLGRRSGLELLASQASARLTLPPMDAGEVAELVRRRLGGPPGPVLRGQLQIAEGNPFFVSVLLDLLEHRHAIHQIDGLMVDVDQTTSAGAESVTAAVRAQIGQLPDDALDLARAVAILGTPAQPIDVAAVLHRPVAGLDPTVRQAAEVGILAWSDDALVFRHDLYREVLVADLRPELRRAAHREAARVLEARGAPAAPVTEHVLRAGDRDAVPLVRQLAATAVADTPGLAADLLAELDLLVTADDAAEIIAERAQALFLAGRGLEAEDLVRTHLPRTRNPGTRARMQALSLRSLINRGNTSAALVEIANLLALPGLPPPVWRELSSLRCWVLLLDGQLHEAEAETAVLLAAVPGTAARRETLRSLAIARACAAWLHGRPREALEIAAELDAEGSDNPLDGRLSSTVWPPIFMAYAHGTTAARSASVVARAQSATRNVQWVQPFHDFVSAGIAMLDGRLDDAAAALDSGLELARETGSGWLSMAVGGRALIDVHRGNLTAARARLDAFARTGLPLQFGWDDPGLARLALAEAEGETESATASAAKLWEQAINRGGELWLVTVAPYVVRIGDTALRAQVAANLERLPQGQVPIMDAIREQAIGMQNRDVGAVTRAAERFTAARDALGAAWAHEEAALLAAEQGDNQRASRALRVALDGYERLAVTSDSDRARRRAHSIGLRAGGPQTRRRPRSGWASLTPTETTVVDLVRQGLTNPQIAHRLFLSPRTVQTHVSHILQKTGLRSRVEIAAASAPG